MACLDTEETTLVWDPVSGCIQTVTTTENGVTSSVDTEMTPDDCCAEGLTTDDAALQVACGEATTVVETSYTWDEGTSTCTEIVTTTTAGIPSVVENPSSSEVCCSLGMTENDPNLLMACEDMMETVLTWDEATGMCT